MCKKGCKPDTPARGARSLGDEGAAASASCCCGTLGTCFTPCEAAQQHQVAVTPCAHAANALALEPDCVQKPSSAPQPCQDQC